MKPLRYLLPLLFVLLSCHGHSPTDPAGGRATLSGVVTDRYGNVWGGVSIGVVDPSASVVADGLTDGHGRYSIHQIRPGHYRIWLQLGRTGPGYFAADVDLHGGENTLDLVSQ